MLHGSRQHLTVWVPHFTPKRSFKASSASRFSRSRPIRKVSTKARSSWSAGSRRAASGIALWNGVTLCPNASPSMWGQTQLAPLDSCSESGGADVAVGTPWLWGPSVDGIQYFKPWTRNSKTLRPRTSRRFASKRLAWQSRWMDPWTPEADKPSVAPTWTRVHGSPARMCNFNMTRISWGRRGWTEDKTISRRYS